MYICICMHKICALYTVQLMDLTCHLYHPWHPQHPACGKTGQKQILCCLQCAFNIVYSFLIQLHPLSSLKIFCSPLLEGGTGCSLNISFFPKILKYSGLWPFFVLPQCQCVYKHKAGRKPTLQQNWQSSKKSQHFKEKQNIY